jgi:DMSO reductase family type II enzyme heme b subunit
VLAPLWWNAHAVLGARLAALHDGTHAALRLSWADDTGEVRLFSESAPSDAAALQLSAAARPALFGMGAPGEPTHLWHWQALRTEEVAGALDLLDFVPHARQPTRPGEVRADVPLYRRLLSQIEPSARVDRITVTGVQTIAAAGRVPHEVRAHAAWSEGRWSVVFLCPLATDGAEEVALRPGGRLQLACAVWNGAAGDGGARKSISIWQELVLER